MGENTAIGWATHTFNPWTGCTKVSPACTNCYAETMCNRFPHLGEWGPGAERKRTGAANWKKPLAWNRKAERAQSTWERVETFGRRPARPRVFCASLADWLDAEVPVEWLADLLNLIVATPHLDWLLLTKRPELWRGRLEETEALHDDLPGCLPGDAALVARDAALVADWLAGTPPNNVWIGVTVEDQKRADERIPKLLEIPARVRFLSCEPLLSDVDLHAPDHPAVKHSGAAAIDWVIAGGESGPKARPSHPDWFRSLRDQCEEAGVPFFFKQWGAWTPGMPQPCIEECLKGKAWKLEAWTVQSSTERKSVGSTVYHAYRDGDTYDHLTRVGKKAAGRELDGRTWDEFSQ